MIKNVRLILIIKIQYIFYIQFKSPNTPYFLIKPQQLNHTSLKSFSVSISNIYTIYDSQLLAWIPTTQNIYDDNLEYLSYSPISFSNFGNRKIKLIVCNTDVVHSLTEYGEIFSWGNDYFHRGLLAMGNKYHIKVPTLNENLSKLNIREIVLGEFHCAAIDYKKNLYTWGENYYGQVGCFNKENNNEKDNNNINLPSKVVINNEGNNNLKVLKVECGKYFTIGISNEGFVFKIGGKYNNNNEEEKQNNNNNIQFLNYFKEIEEYDENNNNKLNFDIENSIYSKVNEIYCNEEIISFINQNGDLFLFSENQGLFHVISKYKFNKIKFINRLFYGINI